MREVLGQMGSISVPILLIAWRSTPPRHF